MNRSYCRGSFLVFLFVCAHLLAFSAEPDTVWVSSLDLTKVHQGWGIPERDRSVAKKHLSLGGRLFERGIGTHAGSVVWFDLAGAARMFYASVGVDDSSGGAGSVKFKVFGDGRSLYHSGIA